MPECITSLFLDEASWPKLSCLSMTSTSLLSESSKAIARPTMPAPIIVTSNLSIKKRPLGYIAFEDVLVLS